MMMMIVPPTELCKFPRSEVVGLVVLDLLLLTRDGQDPILDRDLQVLLWKAGRFRMYDDSLFACAWCEFSVYDVMPKHWRPKNLKKTKSGNTNPPSSNLQQLGNEVCV